MGFRWNSVSLSDDYNSPHPRVERSFRTKSYMSGTSGYMFYLNPWRVKVKLAASAEGHSLSLKLKF